MRRQSLLAALLGAVLFAGAAYGQCAEVRRITVLEDGECGIVDAWSIDYITLETRPDSASQVLTFTGNSSDGDTFTIGATVYTTETGTVGTAFEVNDAATAALFIPNLCAAINDDGAGDGSDYFTGGAHPTVTCSASTATTLTVTAITPGSAQNTIATETTSMDAAWTGATLEDVSDPIGSISRVDSMTATEHVNSITTVTDTDPDVEVFATDWPYYLVTAVNGDVAVGVVP